MEGLVHVVGHYVHHAVVEYVFDIGKDAFHYAVSHYIYIIGLKDGGVKAYLIYRKSVKVIAQHKTMKAKLEKKDG